MRDFKIGKLNGRFVVSWWEDGTRRRFRLDADTLSDAKREAIDVCVRETVRRPDLVTVASLWEAFRRENAGKPSVVTMGFEWKAIEPAFGHLRPEQITIDTCRAYAGSRTAKGIKPGTIWTELGHLRSVMLWAYRRKMIDSAPYIERPRQPAPKERYLTRPECERLIMAATAPHIRLAIILMLSTAARIGAVLDLTWDRVDFERGQIRLRRDDSVTRKGRATVPINAGLRAALSAAKEAAVSDYVVEWAGGRIGSIKTGFRAAVRAAGLKDVSPHTLRHTSLVHLVESGISMEEAAQYAGHSNTAVTYRVYARFSPSHLRKAADILDFTTVRQVR